MTDAPLEPADEFGHKPNEFAPDEAAGDVPVASWIPFPVSDSADYLDRDPPVYLDEGGEQ